MKNSSFQKDEIMFRAAVDLQGVVKGLATGK